MKSIFNLPLYDKAPDNTGDKSTGESFNVKSIVLTPFDLLLTILLIVLHTMAGSGNVAFMFVSFMLTPSLYCAFSYKIGNRFSLLIPVVASVVCAVLSKDIVCFLMPWLISALSFALLRAVNLSQKPKTTAVVSGTVTVLLFLAIVFFIYSVLLDSFSMRAFFEIASENFELFKATFIETFEAMSSELAMQANPIPPEALAASLESMFFLFTVTLPAIIIVWAMVLVYLSFSLLKPMTKLLKVQKMLDGVDYSISLSYVSVVVYFISSILMLFSSGATSYAFRNMTIILSPGLMLCGLKQIDLFVSQKCTSRLIVGLAKLVALGCAVIFGNLGTTILIIMGMYYTTKTIAPPSR